MRGQAHPKMNQAEDTVAFGGPGIEPRWASSAKEGVGTAYHTSCRLWFTLSHGIVNEIYYPGAYQQVRNTTHESGLNLWFADFPTAEWPEGSVLTFTCFWKNEQRWQGQNWQVSVF